MHDVLIVGGGIGGLTAAIALRQKGIDAHVYEQADAPEPVGAGILVPPNAMQILARLGLADAVQARGMVVERAEIRDHRGRRLQTIDLADAARRHGPTVALHRARLHETLLAHLPDDAVHLGARCIDVAHRGNGVAGSVDVRFEDGRTASGAVLVGADGVHSVVRDSVAARARPRHSGQTAYRGVARVRLPDAYRACGAEVWAPGRRAGFAAIGDDAVYWFATFDAPPDDARRPCHEAADLAARLADFGAPVPALVAATDPRHVLRTDLYDLAPLATWHVGRIVLLGDAAHASTPDLGQGGAQAIEDAWVLADRLSAARDGSAHEVERALLAYERCRAPKADRVVRQSRRVGHLAHLANPVGRELRNALMRLTPATAMRRRIDRIYTVGS